MKTADVPLIYTKDNKRTCYAVDTGYAEVLSSKVTILVEGAERSDMIDKEKARKDKADAEARLAKMAKEDQDYEKVRASVTKADMRLKVAEKG